MSDTTLRVVEESPITLEILQGALGTTTYDIAPLVVLSNTESAVILEVPATQGLAGPRGQDGVIGITGQTGSTGPVGATGGGTFVFIQQVSSSTWVINHGLGKWPSVTVLDTAGEMVVGDVLYLDTNRITLLFSASFSGTAYLN